MKYIIGNILDAKEDILYNLEWFGTLLKYGGRTPKFYESQSIVVERAALALRTLLDANSPGAFLANSTEENK